MPTKKKLPPLTEQLRQLIRDSGETVYRIAKETGIVETQLHSFMHGKAGLGLAKLDRLGEYLNLALVEAQTVKKVLKI